MGIPNQEKTTIVYGSGQGQVFIENLGSLGNSTNLIVYQKTFVRIENEVIENILSDGVVIARAIYKKLGLLLEDFFNDKVLKYDKELQHQCVKCKKDLPRPTFYCNSCNKRYDEKGEVKDGK